MLPAALLPLLLATAPSMAMTFSHLDWELACDNTGTCRVAGYQTDEDEMAVSVLLERDAGPGTPVSGRLMLGQYDGDPFADVADAAVTLWIDDEPRGRVAVPEATGALSPTQIAAILPVLAGTGTIAFVADDGRRWSLSPHGSTAVLLKMDDAQGRVGTPGALVRKGTRDESTVPLARPMPEVRVPELPATSPEDVALVNDSEKLRDALDASLGPDDDCFDLLDPEAEVVPLEVVRLDDDKLLVSHVCWLAAYNSGRGYWVIDDLPPWNPVTVTTMGSEFADGTITGSHKGRGLGDCWSEYAWSWDGRRFVPTGHADTGMCKLVAPGGAWSLPTLVVKVERDGDISSHPPH